MSTAEFCITFSSTTRHIIRPADDYLTLCGHRVALPEHYTGDDGQPKTTAPWMVRDRPQCKRCAQAAAKRGIEIGES